MATSPHLFCLIFGIIAVLVCGVHAGDDRIDVEYAQKLYNFRADQVFNTLRDNSNNETVKRVLDELVLSFCPGSSHKGFSSKLPPGKWSQFNVSWTANDAGTVYGTDAIRGMYQYLGQYIFNNDSSHQPFSMIVDLLDGTHATLRANVFTWLNLRIDPYPAFFSLARGFYRNEFTKVNGQWCISSFDAYTLHQGNLGYDVAINYPYPAGMVTHL